MVIKNNNGGSIFKSGLDYSKLFSLFVIMLFLNLPIASALSFSGIGANDVTGTTANIGWETDEAASSRVYFGTSVSDLSNYVTSGDLVTSHSMALTGLTPNSEFFYYLKSGSEKEDNNGTYYSFTTSGGDSNAGVDDGSEDPGSDSSDTNASIDDDGSIDSDVISESTETIEVNESSDSIETTELVEVDLFLEVELPERVKGDEFDFNGISKPNAEIRVSVNGGYFSKRTVADDGTFSFEDVPLRNNDESIIGIEVSIDGEDEISSDFVIISDNNVPEIEIEELPEFFEETSINFSGSISEQVSYKVFVNDNAAFEGEGVTFSGVVSNLEEGNNVIKIVVTDLAGWEITKQVGVWTDTKAPQVDADFKNGEEYYQNRAETDVTGTTEPGSKAYLFVYRPKGEDFKPDFKRARAELTVGETGDFTFKDVDFESEPISLEDITPEKVPAELLEVSIPKTDLSNTNNFNYYVFIIAVDKSGKEGYWRGDVSVKTCYSSNFDFKIENLINFQRPLKLDPNLMDDGREEARAVFKFEYHGNGYTSSTGEKPYQINGVKIVTACTQNMIDGNESYSIGCKLAKSSPDSSVPSPDRLTHYIGWKLHSAEQFSEREDNFWDDFQKRRIVIPLKISITYTEKSSDGESVSKTQNSCVDLSYFVDIPLDSKEMIPDWLADEGTQLLNKTVVAIDKVLPYLEKVILVTGITCFSSIGVKMVVKIARIAVAKWEGLQGKAAIVGGKSKDEVCPLLPNDVNKLYLDKTLEHWKELIGKNDCIGADGKKGNCNLNNITTMEDNGLPDGIREYLLGQGEVTKQQVSLEERCPQTAGLWKAEAGLEQLYKWTCDRFLCRSVPAKWTDDEAKGRIDEAILKQRGCSVTGGCIPLRKIEDCDKYITDNRPSLKVNSAIKAPANCWEDPSSNQVDIGNSLSTSVGDIYVKSESQDDKLLDRGIVKLTRIQGYFDNNLLSSNQILVYQEKSGSGSFCAAKSESCEQTCKRYSGRGYKATTTGFTVYDNKEPSANGSCYVESMVGGDLVLKDGAMNSIRGNKYPAGYTNDCFIGNNGAEKYQCVCEGDPDRTRTYKARTAAPNKGMPEEYFYRQDKMFKESGGLFGTNYPSWRYYKGRDVQGAFGLNYVTDYFRPENSKQFPSIKPNSQYIGAWQTACLTNIRAQLVMLRSILQGLNKCITEAKYTGFQDAGMCKTLFAQHVCGLIYKIISYSKNSCSPSDIGDSGDKEPGLMEYISAGTQSIGEGMDESINELKSDYGNAKLDSYFAAGAQGLTQSMCLAAIGVDWPIGMDFIMDTAYATAMKTSILVAPAEREFSHFDPSSLTAVYNYNVGVAVFPGCKIARYDTYLKCVNQGDMKYAGTSCPPEGCDCLNVADGSTPYENEREVLFSGGSVSNMDQGAMVDLPIEVPQKLNKHFRYDHVVTKIRLAEGYKAEDCFDTGHVVNEDEGIFYNPIKDVSGPGLISCSASISTGQFNCPELSSVFYGDDFAYLEAPFMSCLQKSTGSYISCDTPNLYTLASQDEIIARIHTNSDDKAYCLEVKTSGGGTNYNSMIQIPSGGPGQRMNTINFGTVQESMFGQRTQGLGAIGGNNAACQDPLNGVQVSGESIRTGKTIIFGYVSDSSNKFEVTIETTDSSFGVLTSGYNKGNGNYLYKGQDKSLTLQEINLVEFKLGGFKFSGVMGGVNGGNGRCGYQTQTQSSGSSNNEQTITVRATLKKKPVGSCMSASETVPSISGFGQTSYSGAIKIQRESILQGATSAIFELFSAGKYSQVSELAANLILEHEGTLSEAEGIYYSVMSEVMLNPGNLPAISTSINSWLNRFFLRQGPSGEALYTFDQGTVRNMGEFELYRKYLCVVASEMEYDSSGSLYGCPGETGSASLCGKAGTKAGFTAPSNWGSYTCQSDPTGWQGCLGYAEYTDTTAGGCEGSASRCCAPKETLCGVTGSGIKTTFTVPTNWTTDYSCKASGVDCKSRSDYADWSPLSTYGCPGSEECCK